MYYLEKDSNQAGDARDDVLIANSGREVKSRNICVN